MLTETITTANDHRMTVFKDDFISVRIRARGLYERSSLDFVRNYLRDIDGPVIADIGANVGNHSLDFATYASVVYAFEPVPVTYGLLVKNVTENHFDNIVLINRALSDQSGSSEMSLVPGNMGCSSLDTRREGYERVEVSSIEGDAYFEEQAIEQLDFIKIDIEGHEEPALRGLMKTIQRFRPTIMMEWHDVEAIERINASRFMDDLAEIYDFSVLGTYQDKCYWQGRPLGKFRRRLAKWFRSQDAILYTFDERRRYHNILLMPKRAAE